MPENPARRPPDHALVQSLELLLGDKVEVNDRTLLEGVAELFIHLGRTAEGQQCLQEAKNLHRKTFDYNGDARVLRKLGQVYLQRGDKTEALRVWQQSIHACRDIDDRPGEAAALDLLAGLLETEKRYDEAVRAFEETLAIKSAAGDQVGQARTLTRLGGAHMVLGRYQDALRCLRQAVRIWKSEPNRLKECECLEDIVACYLALGRFVDLVRASEELLELNDSLGRKTDRSSIYLRMAVACSRLGRPQEALKLHGQAVEAAKQEKHRPRLITALLAQGRALRKLDRTADALRLLHAAETEAKAGDGRHLVGDVLMEIGTVHLVARQWGEAAKVLKEAAKLLQTAGAEDRTAQVLVLLAAATAQEGSAAATEPHLVSAHALAQGSGDAHQLAVINSFRGTVAWSAGRHDEALRWLRNGLDLMDDPAGLGRQDEEAVLGSLIMPFDGVVDLSLAHGEVQFAFEAAQRAHGHACVRAAERLTVADKTSNGSGAVGHCERIVAQLRGCNARLEDLHDAASRKNVREQLQELRGELHKHQENAHTHHPEYSPLRFVYPVGLEELQKLLPEGTAMLAWLVGGRQTYMWLATAQELVPFVRPIGRTDLRQLVVGLLRILEQPGEAAQVADMVQALTSALMPDEVFEHLESVGRLVMVPDDILTSLPFGVLATPQSEYLADRFELSFTPSVTAWRVSRGRAQHSGLARATRRVLTPTEPRSATPRRGLLGGHGPLGAAAPFPPPPGSAAVAESASPGVVEVRASHKLEEFETLVRRAAMLHISAPLELNHEAAFASSVALQDGGVGLQHLAHMTLTSHLALLSATHAPSWPRGSGAEWRTLVLPLLYAGLSTVVYTRWMVEEAPRRAFADTLFTQLAAGDSKIEAFHEARRKLFNHRSFAHPHVWAAFEMFGDLGV